jgi:penicillin-binding protein 1A
MNAAALALGGMTKGVSPLEMAGAYGAFVNQGLYTEPVAYTRVENKRGEVILEKIPL